MSREVNVFTITVRFWAGRVIRRVFLAAPRTTLAILIQAFDPHSRDTGDVAAEVFLDALREAIRFDDCVYEADGIRYIYALGRGQVEVNIVDCCFADPEISLSPDPILLER